MDANICINELQAIVDRGAAYQGPHSDPFAHVFGMAAVLRDMASTDDQKDKIAAAISEFRIWFQARRSAPGEELDRARHNVIEAVAKLKEAYAA